MPRCVLGLAVALVASVLLPPAHPSTAQQIEQRSRVPLHHGLIQGVLREELLRLHRTGSHVGRNVQSQLVSLEVTSTRDMADRIRSLGGKVEADIGGRLTAARVPADRVPDLSRTAGVAELYGSRKLHLELDRSVQDIRANQVWSLPDETGVPIQGNHVLVGLVDTGIDYHNPDFRNPDGTTRIKYIWDQTRDGNAPANYGFGYECNSASINDGTCPERDTDGHGTHVAGIAAGNGRSSDPPREVGVAPQADIIMVKSDLQVDHVIAAWKYMIDRALQLGEPIVINDSFGGQEGPHDGSEPEARAVDLLTGPGHIFVKSAGNAGDQGAHVDGTVQQNMSTSIPFDASGYAAKMRIMGTLVFALFYPVRDSLNVTLINGATGERVGPLGPNDRIFDQLSKDHTLLMSIDSRIWDVNYREIYVLLRTTSQPMSGHFTLELSGQQVVDAGRFDAWMLQEGFGAFNGANEADTLSIPADARNGIVVGDYATRASWVDKNNQQHDVCDLLPCVGGSLSSGAMVTTSSQGPTAGGGQKPDIVAPGTMIISTLSRDASIRPMYLTADGNNFVLGGTSMSAAHVTGVIALMLQANPGLDEQSIDSILRSTARHDQFTGSAAWSPATGAGKVDALAAVQGAIAAPHAIKRTPIPTPTPTATPTPVPPTPTAPKTKPTKKPKKCKKGYKRVHGRCKKKKRA